MSFQQNIVETATLCLHHTKTVYIMTQEVFVKEG